MSTSVIILFILALCAICIPLLIRKIRGERGKHAREMEELALKIEEAKNAVMAEYKDRWEYLNTGLLADEHYFAFSEMEKFQNDCKDLFEKLDFLRCNGALDDLGEDAVSLYDKLKSIDTVRKQHNEQFVKRELTEQKEFFDNVLSYPLDEQQRDSILKLEDNCLVISSAGSGKTSTMIGKLLYLVQQRKIHPSRILTITYTHKASEELTQRLKGTGLSCMTFHKLAMNIVARVEGKMPSIAEQSLFVEVFYEQLKKTEFREAVLNYLTDYKSLVKSEHDYNTAFEYYRDRKKYGVTALYTDKDDRLILTKSEEEKKICSYLTELGVQFKYEQPYEHDTLTDEYRQYKPDFTIFYKDAEGNSKHLYLEHYAINKAGNVPRWFGTGNPDGWNGANERYKEGIEWKRNLHKVHGTKLLYTTSAQFHDNTIRDYLRKILTEAGVPLAPQTTDQLIEKIMTRNKSFENALLQMTQSFINLVKANDKTIDDIRQKAEENHSVRDLFVIDKIMRPLWNDYQKALEERKEMDFTDVIVKATKYCNEGKWNQKYEFILIDEFQDISVDRYRFLLSLRSDLPKTKLYCVGDDWQSIYRFSGSDMSLFSDFSKYFGFTEECKIETTYRFGNPLIDESSKFVQHNPMQKKKSVHPRSVNPPQTKISFMGYNDRKQLQSYIERMVQRVPEDKSIYIISRYSFDVKDIISDNMKVDYDQNTDSITLTISGRRVKFMTIHGSKGLEADYIFLINCNSGLYGFPSLVSDDPVLDYVLSKAERFEYAEERRVFYVGITRAKVHTVVLYNNETPSPFVSEMSADVRVNPDPCPWCKTGRRILRYQGMTKQKSTYRVWACDNREANCQYFEREFLNDNPKGHYRRYIPTDRKRR